MAEVDGPAYEAMASAMKDAYGTPMTTLGQGGSIPLCNVFAETYPDAELIMIGVEEPAALIHAPNESVAPSEIQSMALTEALFLQRYATARASSYGAAGSYSSILLRQPRQHERRWSGGVHALPQLQRSHTRFPSQHGGVS